jgi:Uncharacterized protein conserved in bacteria with the myosin-like domain
MYGIVLIAVLIITGGVIAFIGDRLGTKIGKKKLSVFGLRPRHTSIVITIITGIMITTLTFGVMAAVSENVRTALFGMEKLNRQMQLTQAELEQADKDLTAANAARDKAKADFDAAQAEVEKMRIHQAELSRQNQALETGNRELASANSGLEQQNNALGDMNNSLVQKNDEISAENKTLEIRTKNLKDGLQFVREGDIVYQAGEVIASGVVKKTTEKESLSAGLASIIYLANRNVAEKTGINAGNEGILIYQSEYQAAVDKMEGLMQDSVVRIVAGGNLVRGEPVRPIIEIYPNRTIYQENEFVFTENMVLRGKVKNEAQLAVFEFLKHVNTVAVNKGVLADPLKGSVGIMGGDQLYDIINSLTPIRGSVRLSAYAAQSTDALGPLRLRIKAEKLSD